MDQQQPPPPSQPESPPPPQQWQQQPPPQQGWTPPPQQPMGWGGPGYAAPPPRPLGVTLASLYLIVMGVIFLLGGAACAAGGALFTGAGGQVGDQVPAGLLGMFAGALFFLAILALIFGVVQIAAGAGGFGGRGWARWIGIIFSIILAFFLILGGVTSLGDSRTGGSGITSLVVGVLYALTAWAYIQAGPWFAWRR